LTGLLYLENNLAPRAFTSDRFAVLELLGSQAAISLENARLYADLRQEISERSKTEEALGASEERMNLAAEAANLAMWQWDAEKDEIWMTDKGRALYGFAADTRLDAAAVAAHVHPEDRAARNEAIKRALETRGEVASEYRLLLPDGTLRWIESRGRCVDAGKSKGIQLLGVSLDVTTQKQAEAKAWKQQEELAHLSRVALMGEMAGALAHELNQPLTGIVTNASAARRFIAKGRADLPKLDSLFEAVIEDGRRAGEIIRGIRGMVHKGNEVRGPVNLNDVIASVLRFVRSDALERHFVLVTELDPELAPVEADRVQLQQVLLNLIVNAFEAMREAPVTKRRVIIRSERESGGRVRVSVRDFGTGLPVEEPERIFERFFSTKREGMGMGLAIARSIIASHGGELAAVNADGGGACVYFSLSAQGEG
jgi:PAS domain S-box-containing protein